MGRRDALFALLAAITTILLPDEAEARRRRRSILRGRSRRRSYWREAPSSRPSYAGGTYYQNCSQARAAGATPVRRGDPGYRAALDRDNDGVGCE